MLAPGGARVTVAAYTPSPAQAVAAAHTLGDPRGPLASRLGALDAPGRLRTVTAAAHAGGGCVALSFDLAPREVAVDAPGRIATAAALARQEIGVELSEISPHADIGGELALGADDPREAADRAAWWVLMRAREGDPAIFASRGPVRSARDPGDVRISLAIGLATNRDAASPGASHGDPAKERAGAIRSDLDRATALWHVPVVEARSRAERGQGELWVLVASPCGTAAENDGDAGLGAVAATAMAEQAARARMERDRLTAVEPFIAPDGLGVLAHGPAAPGESPAAHARRLANLAGRSFAADPLDPALVSRARTALFAHAAEPEGRVWSALAGALSPGHPAWVSPSGTADALAHASDASALAMAQAMRAGPVRVAVIANDDAAQAQLVVKGVDRWIARRPGESRACALVAPTAPRPGTYAVDAAGPAGSEALLALALPPGDKEARLSAAFIAAALDGPEGLLARAIGEAGLAESFDVTVAGGSRSPALLVRVAAANASLDAAVAQTRALLDRVRQGALTDADRARATAGLSRARLSRMLNPRARLLALFRGEDSAAPAAPTIEALRAFASATLKDDALVIVAARPSRGLGP